ncbi:MAG TPA: transketolase C-terminal domain-containing protein, partial [Mariniphaga sp.]|nr:transketolase C-terminal domain-containing protein [Mariniphaga sp.]
ILSDGAIGQMMEKVELSDFKPRWTNDEIVDKCASWASIGKPATRDRNVVTSLELDSLKMESNNHRFQEKYRAMEANEQRYEAIECDDADYILVAFGTSARVCQKAVEIARAKGIKVGLLRPITLFPFPKKAVGELAHRVKGFLSVEMNAGQMTEDIKLAAYEAGVIRPVDYFGRMGGIIPSPGEVVNALEQKLLQEVL